MYCQKCRVPLKLDNSLDDLSPAAFDILVGATAKTLPERPRTLPSSSQPHYPPERQELYDRISQNATDPVHTHVSTSPGQQSFSPNAAGMSFIVLSDSQIVPPGALQDDNEGAASSQGKGESNTLKGPGREPSALSIAQPVDQMEKLNRLFEILSSHSDIDHPICNECTDILITDFSQRLQIATKERDAYIAYLKNLNNTMPSDDDAKKALTELEEALAEESKAFQELVELEKTKAAIELEITAFQEEERAVDEEEEKFWREKNEFTRKMMDFQDERDSVAMKCDHDIEQLERLKRTNVYADAFSIGHDGPFATINGLRLGRLANHPVDWTEINAAWGQALLLLNSMAERLGYKFKGYRLRPMGSRSTIEKIEYPSANPRSSIMSAFGGTGALGIGRSSQANRTQSREREPSLAHSGGDSSDQSMQPKITTLDLFATEISSYLPLPNRRFDNGMVAFLHCLKQLGQHVEQKMAAAPKSISLPTPDVSGRLHWTIERDKIKDTSIRIGLKQGDETWTRACKYTLTCCKFLLACVSNMPDSQRLARAAATAASSRRPAQPA